MQRHLIFVFAAFLCTTAGSAASRGQSLQSTQPAPAAAPTSASAQDSAPADSPAPEKKVWTNEDLSGLDAHSAVSPAGTQPKNAPRRPAPAGHNARWYHDQIARLQAKLPPLDTQIAALQSALDGKPVGDAKQSVRPYYGIKRDDWSSELADLRKKRDDTLAQIDALEIQARRAGVPANALP